jgi:hypothetical protein
MRSKNNDTDVGFTSSLKISLTEYSSEISESELLLISVSTSI